MIHSYVSSRILNFIDSMRVNDKVVSTKTSWNMWNNVNCQNENKRSFNIAESRDIDQDVNIHCPITWFKIRNESILLIFWIYLQGKYNGIILC